MTSSIRSLSLGFAAGCVGLAANASAQAQLWDLGPGVFPQDASGNGSVVVGDNLASGEYFEWTANDGIVDIGGVTAGNGVGGTPSISDDGTRVSGTNLNGTTFHEMSYYERNSGQWFGVGGIGAPCSTEISSGWGISGDGENIVGLGWLSCADAHASQWTEGGGPVMDLGSSVPNRSSRANAADFDGNTVAGWQDDVSGFRQAAVWVDGAQTLITDQMGNPVSEASDVDGNGEWVVGIGAAGGQGWRWSEDTGLEELGTLNLPGFGVRGFSTAIDGDGARIVGFDRGFGPPTGGEGWIWDEDLGFMGLNDYFDSLGIENPDNIRFSLPLGISADGKTICGAGRSDSQFLMGWVVDTGEQECFLVLGNGPGNARYAGDGHWFDTQIDQVNGWYSVLMNNIAEVEVPSVIGGSLPGGGGGLGLTHRANWVLAAQILMWNPQVFPGQPEQYTAGMMISVSPSGGLRTLDYGNAHGGLEMQPEVRRNAEGKLVLAFPFTIAGL